MKFLSVLFFILIAFELTYSQNNNDSDTTLVHGIQFQLPNILKISNFDGYTFSYRYKKNKTSTYRFGFTSNLLNRNTDETFINDTTSDNNSSQVFHGTIKFSAQYLKTIMFYNKFALIVGGGPFVLYHNISNSNVRKYISLNTTIQTERSSYGIGLGADLISGVEYHLYNNILISAEYNLTLLWDKSTNKNKDIFIDGNSNTQTKIKNRTNTTTTISVSGNRVLLGITFYF